ncbi:MAG: hypothetical protein U0797_20450 [Gemmataceae bacterium]
MSPRRTRNDTEKQQYALAAAYLASLGDTQTEIGEKLEIKQPEVSRLLRLAEGRKWLTYRDPAFDPKGVEELWEAAQAKFAKFLSPKGLLEKLQRLQPGGVPRLRSVTVIRHQQGTFHPSVTEAIKAVLHRAAVVGVTWGRTMYDALQIFEKTLQQPIRVANPIQFVPLCGEPMMDVLDPLHYSSSALVAVLHEKVNGKAPGDTNPPPPSLGGVPIIIPAGYTSEEVQVIRHYIGQVSGYGIVFGKGGPGGPRRKPGAGAKPGLVEQVDTVLTSLGVAKKEHRGIFLQQRVDLGDISERELTATVVGDIGGVIIPTGGELSPAAARKLEEMGERWTGVKLHHLERCAGDAVKGGKPGVVVFSRGGPCPQERATVVRRAIELGLVNELVCDGELADALGGGTATA